MKHNLLKKIVFVFLLSHLSVVIFTLVFVYDRLDHRIISDYERMAEGLTLVVESVFDPDRIDEYIEGGFDSPEYMKIWNQLSVYKNSYPDVLYLYIYRCLPDGGFTVFDIDPEPDEIGYIYEYDSAFKPYAADLCAGKWVPPMIDKSREYGYLMTYTRPVFDSDGNYACTIFVDYSMIELHSQDVQFMFSVGSAIFIYLFLLVVVCYFVLKSSVTDPIDRMAVCIQSFKYDTEVDRFNNANKMEALDIRSKDEVGILYEALCVLIKESLYYMTNLNRVKDDVIKKNEIIEHISQDAYIDALTGAGNLHAYQEKVNEINRLMTKDKFLYGVLMADINNLKRVNDEFGHDKGDIYIKGCCQVLYDVFKLSEVFRIGGDEFVIILFGNEYENRNELLAELVRRFDTCFSAPGRRLYEQYSMSFGLTEVLPSDDSFESVFKRADALMYDNKKKFHDDFGEYR